MLSQAPLTIDEESDCFNSSECKGKAVFRCTKCQFVMCRECCLAYHTNSPLLSTHQTCVILLNPPTTPPSSPPPPSSSPSTGAPSEAAVILPSDDTATGAEKDGTSLAVEPKPDIMEDGKGEAEEEFETPPTTPDLAQSPVDQSALPNSGTSAASSSSGTPPDEKDSDAEGRPALMALIKELELLEQATQKIGKRRRQVQSQLIDCLNREISSPPEPKKTKRPHLPPDQRLTCCLTNTDDLVLAPHFVESRYNSAIIPPLTLAILRDDMPYKSARAFIHSMTLRQGRGPSTFYPSKIFVEQLDQNGHPFCGQVIDVVWVSDSGLTTLDSQSPHACTVSLEPQSQPASSLRLTVLESRPDVPGQYPKWQYHLPHFSFSLPFLLSGCYVDFKD